MTQVLSDSVIGYPQTLAIFSKPLQNVGVRRYKTVEYFPINDIATQSVIQFLINPSGANYVDLSRTILNLQCMILRKDGSRMKDAKPLMVAAVASSDTGADAWAEKPPAEDVVAPVANFLHSMFSRVDLSLQNKLMTDSDNSYAYQAYFKTLLQTPPEAREHGLEAQMWYPAAFYDAQEKTKLDTTNWVLSSDEGGVVSRGDYFNASNVVDMCGKLACDAFDIGRLLPNGLPIQLTLYPNQPDFCLLSPQTPAVDYKIVITKATLDVCLVDVSPEIVAAHSEILKAEPAIFPYTKTEIKKFTLSKGVYGGEFNNAFESRLPSEMVIGLVSGAGSHGDYNRDPFCFENCGLNFIQVTCDGEDLTNSPVMTKYGDTHSGSQYIEGYKTLAGVNGRQGEIPISRTNYFTGYTLYRFVVENDDATMSSGEVVPLKRNGNVRIVLKFDKPLTETKTVVIFAKFPAGFTVDKNRGVHDM